MKRWLLPVLGLMLFPSITALHSETFDMDEWQEIRTKKEDKTFQEESVPAALPQSFQTISSTATLEPTIPPILSEGIELPYESKLAISGRKFIGMKFTSSKYLHKREDERTSPTPVGFELSQQLQVRVKGTVKRKISVNVDYDDTVENKKDISIVYKGDPEELVQEASFGDITLSLPGTEFVSYNKAAFGAMANLKYKKAKAYGIFSRTKGTTETKRFSGATTFEKKDISDISYIRRRYYKLWLDKSHLPIKPGSEKIYLDDKDATNNTVLTSTITAAEYGVANSTISMSADLLYPGSDYTIDYINGVIVFKKTIQSNYVIAVDYEKSDGTRVFSDGPMPSFKLIKNELESIKNELKNYYLIGRNKIIRDDNKGNFIFKVLDLSRVDVPNIAQYPSNVEVDFEAGTFRFTDGNGNDREPFPASTYANSPTHNYTIYTEYKYRTKSYLVRGNIVPQSEVIVMDGVKLVRDTDYFMDYDSGFITFLNEEKINDNTQIEVTYEWAPFGGQLEQTVMGVRGEYNPFNNISVGSTFLYNFPTKPLTSPDVRSTPESISVYEVDSLLSFPDLLFKPSFAGEFASSIRNPNIFGNAMIENMEGSKQADTMPTDMDFWKMSANPGAEQTAKDAIWLSNTDIKNVDINPNVPELDRDTKQQVLSVSYKLNPNKEASIVYPISKIGVDYTKKLFLDFWMYGDGSNDEITFSVGTLNEDSDGNGTLETEDKNWDGILGPGEDIGIPFHHPDGITIIGAGNTRIDTEDLDGDGILRRQDSTSDTNLYKMSDGILKDEEGRVHNTINWSGQWKHFIVPLTDASKNVSQWTAVKQIRLTIKSPAGDSSTRNIMFSDISFVGNKWENATVAPANAVNNMVISAVNNVDNTNYTPLYKQFSSIYKDLYNIEPADLKGKKEQALSLKYTLNDGSTASTRVISLNAVDYSKHKEIVYFLWSDSAKDAKGATFSIQFGAENAYFEHSIVPTSAWNGWKKIVLKMVDINGDGKPEKLSATEGTTRVVGIPSFSNISQIKLSVINHSGSTINDGEILVNEIYLNKAWQVTGYAHRENVDMQIPDWASFGGKYKYVDRNFQTLTTQIANRDTDDISSYFNMPQFWFFKPYFLNWISMPVNVAVSKSQTVTPSAVQTNDPNLVSILEEGKVVIVNGNASTSISIRKLPRLGASYSRVVNETVNKATALAQHDETNSYTGTMDYTNPLKLYVTPNDFSLTYVRSDAYRSLPSERVVNFRSLTEAATSWFLLTYSDDYSGRISLTPLGWMDDWFGIKPFSNFQLSPTYKFVETWEKKILNNNIENLYPKSAVQTASLTTSFSVFPWFQPTASYNINTNQSYDVTPSTVILAGNTTGFVPADKKTLDRSSGGNVSITLTPRDIVNFKPINSLYLNSSYNISNGDSYEKVNRDEKVFDKLWIDDKLLFESTSTARRKSLTLSDTVQGNVKWSPIDFINFPGRLEPFKSITTASAYSQTDTKSETTGTRSRSITLNWPDVTATISGTEKFFFIEKYVTDSIANFRYAKKAKDEFAFSDKTKISRSFSNDYDYRFNLLKKFDCYSYYGFTTNLDQDLVQHTIIADGHTNSMAFQVGYRLGDWRFTPRYDKKTEYEVDGTPKVTKDSLTHTATIGVNYDVTKPFTWLLPFVSKRYNMDSRFTATGNVKYIQGKDKIVQQNNTKAYSVNFTGDYAVSISNNLRFNFTPSGTFLLDTKQKQESYYSYDISSSLTITF